MTAKAKKLPKGITELAEGFHATRDFTFLPVPKTNWNKTSLEEFRASLTPARLKEDEKQLSRLFSIAAKVPELKAALDWANEHNIDLIVDRTSRGIGGYYSVGSGVVAFSAPAFGSDMKLAGVAVHEIRHAWQDYYGMIATADTKFADYFIKIALIEADATAHQMLAEEQASLAGGREAAEARWRQYPVDDDMKRTVRESHDRREARLQDRDKYLWEQFKGWYTSFRPASYGDTAARAFGTKLGIPGIKPQDFKFEFRHKEAPGLTGVDFARTEQLRRLGKGFKGGNYFDVAPTEQLARKYLSPGLADRFFRATGKAQKLATEIRLRQLKLKAARGKPQLISLV